MLQRAILSLFSCSAQQIAIVIAFFSPLAGCMMLVDLNDHVTSTEERSDSGSDAPTMTSDAFLESSKDSGPLICEPNSCKPGCGSCEAGTTCGTAGLYVCGSSTCGGWIQEAGAGALCTGTLPHLFQCFPQTTPDFMPGCTFMGVASGENWYCCK